MSQPHLKLVSFKVCPYVQRVVITLQEKNMPYEIEYIDLSNKPAWFLKLSPLGRVPITIVNDKDVLFESAAIVEYVEEITSDQPLHPRDPVKKARDRAWVEFASGLFSSLSTLISTPDQHAFDEKVKEIEGKFQLLEKEVKGPFFNGEFSLVDVFFAPAFRQFDQFEDDVQTNVFANTPKVQDWRRALRGRRSIIDAVLPEFPRLYKDWIKAKNGILAKKWKL